MNRTNYATRGRPWTKAEDSRLTPWANRDTIPIPMAIQLAKELNRTRKAVHGRVSLLRRRAGNIRPYETTHRYKQKTSERAPAYLFDDRDVREAARERRDLTQTRCGDPPPGLSALDGMTGQTTQPASRPYSGGGFWS